MAIADLDHPPRTGKMGVIDEACAIRFDGWINPENDMNSFAPIGIFRCRIEQPPIGAMMAFVILGYVRRVGGLIVECGNCYRLAPASANEPCSRRSHAIHHNGPT